MISDPYFLVLSHSHIINYYIGLNIFYLQKSFVVFIYRSNYTINFLSYLIITNLSMLIYEKIRESQFSL